VSISSKVSLYATLPALGILLYGIASILIYPTTIEARVSILSSVATGVTVLFLISERLRESAHRKLDYLNRKALTPALDVGKGGIQNGYDGNAKTLSQCRDLLAHHGRFLRIRLYPKNLLYTLDVAKDAILSYYKLYQRVTEIGYKAMGQAHFNIWAVLIILGFMDKGNYNDELLDPHRDFLTKLKETEPKLAEQFPQECKKISEATRALANQIEAFFLDNQLEGFHELNPFGRSGLP
jgi:hypothetical protein